MIHRAIYRHRDDVNAVIHHHAPEVLPFAITNTEIRPAFQMGVLFRDGVPKFSDYDEQYGWLIISESEGDRMAENLGNHRAQLLEGHGANVVGNSLKEAVLTTIYFVMNARYLAAGLSLSELTFKPDSEAAIDSMINNVIFGDMAVDRMWTFLTNRLPGRD